MINTLVKPAIEIQQIEKVEQRMKVQEVMDKLNTYESQANILGRSPVRFWSSKKYIVSYVDTLINIRKNLDDLYHTIEKYVIDDNAYNKVFKDIRKLVGKTYGMWLETNYYRDYHYHSTF